MSKNFIPFILTILLLPEIVFAYDISIGAAAVKITPQPGTPMAGYYFTRGAVNVHDDIYAKALVIEKNNVKIAVVSCDLVKIPAGIVSEARALIEKSTGIAPDHIMIGATHTHTGPVILDKDNKDKMREISNALLENYMSRLAGLIEESVRKANNALRPANLSVGLGQEASISFNRRYYMSDGTVGWNPGKLNPKIVKPAGPIDPDVFVLYAETSEGKAISTYVNFALHLDNVGGTAISADLPYTMSTNLGKIKGPDMVSIFSQGCSGNINHLNVKDSGKQAGHAEAERLGTVLSGEIIKTYTRLKAVNIGNILVKQQIVKLPLAEVSPDEIVEAHQTAATYGKPDGASFMELVKASKVLDVYGRKRKPIDAEVQVFALGDELAIVSLPGEIFTELGMYIKERSPYKHTIIVELANGAIGYVPDRKAYAEGAYEPVSSRCAPGSGEMLAETALALLNELKGNKPAGK